MIRITADLDKTLISIARARTKAIKMYLSFNNIYFDKTTIRKSSSGKGCHVILWTNNYLDDTSIFFIRCLLGDDWKRVKLDMKRKKPTQYLFNKKVKLK